MPPTPDSKSLTYEKDSSIWCESFPKTMKGVVGQAHPKAFLALLESTFPMESLKGDMEHEPLQVTKICFVHPAGLGQ